MSVTNKGILYLTHDDFAIVVNSKGNKSLCHGIDGLSIVLFYSNDCEYCDAFKPIFRELSTIMGGCSFGMLNVMNNREIIKISSTTTTKIEAVPYIILYINGRPFMRYDGERTTQHVREFITGISEKINHKQSFMTTASKNEEKDEIPEFAIPKNRRKKCYVIFDEAYGGTGGTSKKE